MQNVPEPSLEAQQHSQALCEHIQNECIQNGGHITFKRFMELALYTPGLGYYSAGNYKFGPQGDFVTAPEISSLFGQTLSHALDDILEKMTKNACILELGAGTGKLAADILENLQYLPEKYFILDISADLIERQKNYLQNRLKPDLFHRIQWLNTLPSDPFNGVILANEVIDAMPVHKIQIQAENHIVDYREYYVCYKNGEFQWQLDTISNSEFIPELDHIAQLAGLDSNAVTYRQIFDSEINTDLSAWLKGLSECLTQGVMLFVDYGFPAHEYYHPERSMGTLMCHYRHRAHDNVFHNIGLSDITAHVDFSALAQAADQLHLQVAGFTTQGAYLIANNLGHYAQQAMHNTQSSNTLNQANMYMISQQVQQLTSHHEMGELFKVMALTKDWEYDLSGFQLRDHLYRL